MLKKGFVGKLSIVCSLGALEWCMNVAVYFLVLRSNKKCVCSHPLCVVKHGPGSMNAILRQLMEHEIKGVDRNVAQAAIEHLLKRLPSKEELSSLVTAVTTKGGQPTGCVTTKRTVDGRVHISRGEKGIPSPYLFTAVALAPSEQQEPNQQQLQICVLHDGVVSMRKPIPLRAAGR